MVVRLRTGKDARTWRTGHKSTSLFLSVIFHGSLVALAFLPSDNEAEQRKALNATILELTHDHPVLYYDFRQELPDVSATNATANKPKPSPDAVKAKQNIVAAPNEKNGKQFVYLPAPRIKIETDLKAPNLIALAAPPPPPKPQPKAFHAPELEKRPAPAAPSLPAAPALAGSAPEKQSAEVAALLNKPTGPPPKQFVVPKTARAVPAEVAALESAPTLNGAGNDKQNTDVGALLSKPGGPPPKPFTPPPARANRGGNGSAAAALPAPPSVAEGAGAPATASLAIIGLNPTNVPQMPVPEGSRPARIVAGTPSPGPAELGGGNSPIAVPNLSVQGAAPRSPSTAVRGPQEAASSQGPAIGLAHPQTPQFLPASPHVSVPQWPNTRFLPALVERHFQGRVSYTTLVPAQSGDDWVIWFAETMVTPVGDQPLVRPPGVLRSVPLPPIPARNDHGSGRLRITGIIHKDGRIDSVSELSGGSLDREFAAVLQTWQFLPATRNNAAIDADAVIEIPVSYGALSLR